MVMSGMAILTSEFPVISLLTGNAAGAGFAPDCVQRQIFAPWAL